MKLLEFFPAHPTGPNGWPPSGAFRPTNASGASASDVLFDSTILIAHLRGDVQARELLRREAGGAGAYASVISRAEIEGGMRSDERQEVGRLFEGLTLLPVTDAIARRAGRHLRAHRASHPGIDLADYLIGATAEEHGLKLATLNVRHFPALENLQQTW
jgi:predicted nucleic acid-binding protein